MSETINFSVVTGSMRHREWIQEEDRGFTTRAPRPVNYTELFTDLSPSPLLLYFRETKSDGKYRERVKRKEKIDTNALEKRNPSFTERIKRKRLSQHDVICFILIV